MATTNKARHTWWDLLMLLVAPEAEYRKYRRRDHLLNMSQKRIQARMAWEHRQGWDRLSRDERINRYFAAVRDARRERAA